MSVMGLLNKQPLVPSGNCARCLNALVYPSRKPTGRTVCKLFLAGPQMQELLTSKCDCKKQSQKILWLLAGRIFCF